MKILKYKKGKKNEYKIITDEEEYTLYDDMIIKYELLLKKEINKKEWESILKENQLLKAYYEGLKAINTKLRTEKELRTILRKKGFSEKEINYAIERLAKDGYLNHLMYIEAFIHDAINLNTVGKRKIHQDLQNLGFTSKEIDSELNKIDDSIYEEKIAKYINKKLKGNKKSANEFMRKITLDLINKGFEKENITSYLNTLEIEDNILEIEKLVNKLYKKYIVKYDLYTTKKKIMQNLYAKGYTNVDINEYIAKIS